MTTASVPFASDRSSDIGAALLRATSGIYFLVHGSIKLFIFTPAGTAGYFQSIGLPGFLGYITILIEILGGLMLIAGYKTRLVAAVMIPVLLGAAFFGHGGNGFTFSNPNGGWEYPIYWAVAMAAQALIGAGAYSVDKR
jgi:putative oxidoreductase